VNPLSDLPRETLAGARGVLTDLDDTLTTDGRLGADAFTALHALHDAGLRVIPITGRPAGWCDHIARMWPIDAVVGENGAFYLHYDRPGRKLRLRRVAPEADFARLRAIGERVIAAVPGAAWASDQPYRIDDIAIDFREDVPPLAEAAVDRIVALLEAEGLQAKVSSIHVNAWFGGYDKLSTTRLALAELFGEDLEQERERYLFIGDSPNDVRMFDFFPCSVGVANVRQFAQRMTSLPKYITDDCCGAGFAELSRMLLRCRKSLDRRGLGGDY